MFLPHRGRGGRFEDERPAFTKLNATPMLLRSSTFRPFKRVMAAESSCPLALRFHGPSPPSSISHLSVFSGALLGLSLPPSLHSQRHPPPPSRASPPRRLWSRTYVCVCVCVCMCVYECRCSGLGAEGWGGGQPGSSRMSAPPRDSCSPCTCPTQSSQALGFELRHYSRFLLAQ